VLVSQNRQAEKDRMDTELDYQVNVKAQTEILGIAQRLARIEDRLEQDQGPDAESGEPPSGR
jgi:CRP/FNR family transcriptional regulator, cyclic AMP receptor protein